MPKRIKRIILIEPPYTISRKILKGLQPPLGLAYLAASLEKSGYEVKILDAVAEGYENETRVNDSFIRYGLPDEEIKERIKKNFTILRKAVRNPQKIIPKVREMIGKFQ